MSESESEQGEGQPPVRIVEATGTALAEVTVTAVGTVRRTFALRHLMAADYFVRELRRIEADHEGGGLGEPYDRCSHNATAAIILAFASIEATLDEVSEDVGVPDEVHGALEKAPTMEWAQALLALREKPTFDKGAEPYQSVNTLRAVRNALVHPKAEWDDDMDRNAKLSAKIKALGVPLSPFWPDDDLAFPHGCMSAGFAAWAAGAARAFIRELRARLDLPPTA